MVGFKKIWSNDIMTSTALTSATQAYIQERIKWSGQNTKLLTSEEEFSEGWVYGGFDAFTAHGQG